MIACRFVTLQRRFPVWPIALLFAFASFAEAQMPERFTIASILQFSPGSDGARAALAAAPGAAELIKGDFGVGLVDLNDDGAKEIVVLSLSCTADGCPLAIYERQNGQTVRIFAQPIPGRVGLSNEKVNGYRAIVAADAAGAPILGQTPGTPLYGKQLVAVIGPSPTAATAVQLPAAPAATPPPPAMPHAAASTAPAASPSLDVLGVRLGMPLEEAIAALKAYDAAMQAYPSKVDLGLGGTTTIGAVGVIMAAAKTGGRYEREHIVLEAAPGPEPAVVTAILRLTRYQEPLALDKTLAAITGKYGKAAFEVALPTSSGFTWYYDANGSAIYPPDRLSCGGARSIQTMNSPRELRQTLYDPTPANQAAANCGAFLSINLVREGDVVTYITTYASDERLRAHRFNAMKALLAEAAAEQNRKQAEEAASREGPDL